MSEEEVVAGHSEAFMNFCLRKGTIEKPGDILPANEIYFIASRCHSSFTWIHLWCQKRELKEIPWWPPEVLRQSVQMCVLWSYLTPDKMFLAELQDILILFTDNFCNQKYSRDNTSIHELSNCIRPYQAGTSVAVVNITGVKDAKSPPDQNKHY
ncbi:uncharacterized protein LOC144302848 [Canis aureus]